MSDAASREQLRRTALIEGLYDWVSLRFLASTARALEPGANEDRVRELVLDTLRGLLREELVVLGTLEGESRRVIPWSDDVTVSLDRIQREWEQLLTDPYLVMEAWTDNTSVGDKLAREMASNGAPDPRR
jgi:hypothetical protein